MAGINFLGKRMFCLAAVALLVVAAGVGAQLKPAAVAVPDGDFMAFNGFGVADPYGWFAGSGWGEAVVEMRKKTAEPMYFIYNKIGGAGFEARDVDKDELVGSGTDFATVLEGVRVAANGRACDIVLGDGGTGVLNMGSNTLTINGATVKNVKWGEVRLSGKLTSERGNASALPQSIIVSGGATVKSSAEVATKKDIAVQVNDSSEFTYMSETNVTCGKIVNTGTNGSTVKVVSGYVSQIDNGGNGVLEVIGGQIGNASNYDYAIKNSDSAETVISGKAKVISSDTSRGGGTIINNGKLEISGGQVWNASTIGYFAAVNNDYSGTKTSPNVEITGSADISSKNGTINNWSCGTILNRRGKIRISGGYIHNDEYTTGAIIFTYDDIVISDSAKINGEYTICLRRNDDGIVPKLDISGGTITAGNGHAINMDEQTMVQISGNAEIINNSESPTIRVTASAQVHLYGGTVKNLNSYSNPRANAIYMYASSYGIKPIEFKMGGSPVVKGSIEKVDSYTSMELCTDSGYEFKPYRETYRMRLSSPHNDSGVLIFKKGAGFINNFVADTLYNKDVEFAVNGDDLFYTIGKTHRVAFNLNGAISSDSLKDITVVHGRKIGKSAKPETDSYAIFEQTKDSIYQVSNDGKWHVYGGKTGSGEVIIGGEFIFDAGKQGTDVNDNLTLILSWDRDNRKFYGLSVLESSRALPSARPSESAAIAPVAAASGSLTAGPTPVSRSVGAVNFFRSGVPLRGGKLFIYDASGSMVATAQVSDPSGGSGRRSVAKWNLQDAKGRDVAEGTYVARGVITTKAGKTERVSVLVNVQR